MQSANRKEVGEPRIAHRIFIGFGDSTAVSAGERRRNAACRSGHIGAHVVRNPALHPRKPMIAGSTRLEHLNRIERCSRCRQSLKPRRTGKIITSGEHRRRGGDQPCFETYQRAFLRFRRISLQRHVYPHSDRTARIGFKRRQRQSHPVLSRFFLAYRHSAFDLANPRCGNRRHPPQRRFGPDDSAACCGHQSYRYNCLASIGKISILAQQQ